MIEFFYFYLFFSFFEFSFQKKDSLLFSQIPDGDLTVDHFLLKNIEFLEELKALNADLQIVVAFRMLPQQVWEMPLLGTINVHGSLLPNYRGAAPINWAIMNGEKETGVTTFKLQHAIDTGNILLQKKLPILDTDTMGSLYDKMKLEGALILLETLEKLKTNTLEIIPSHDCTLRQQ